MARDGFKPVITDVPFDPEIVAGAIQYLPLDQNSLVKNGVMFEDPRFVREAGRNTGKITLPAYTYDENDDEEDWDASKDGSTSKLPNTSQTSVVISRFKAFEYNYLANVISNGMTPNQAVANYIGTLRDKAMFKVLKRVLKGVFEASDVAEKLIYDISSATRTSLKTEDFLKARTHFWGDTDTEPVFYIMHSVTYTALMTQLTETTMKNFIGNATIIKDDKLCDAGSGTYKTYIFRRNAIATSGDLAGSRAFTFRDELKEQGTEGIGYRRRYILSPVGINFKGNLSKATGATTAELELGTNWGLLDMPDAHKRVRMGMIISKESIDPAGLSEVSIKKAEASKKGE